MYYCAGLRPCVYESSRFIIGRRVGHFISELVDPSMYGVTCVRGIPNEKYFNTQYTAQ